jgi:predicted RNA-binding Zn ribbon-like protein
VYDTILTLSKDAAMDRLPALFLGDATGLDFLNSIATPVDTPVDWIPDGDSLLDWLAQAGLVPAGALKTIRAQARSAALDKVAAEARDLREWFRGFVLKHKGHPLAATDLRALAPLNRLLEREDSFSRIVSSDGADSPFVLERVRRFETPDSLLLPIAEAIARLVATEDFSHVKACEGPTCTLLFADHTRGHARRWCSMALCGNRAKQAAHRARRKEQRH